MIVFVIDKCIAYFNILVRSIFNVYFNFVHYFNHPVAKYVPRYFCCDEKGERF